MPFKYGLGQEEQRQSGFKDSTKQQGQRKSGFKYGLGQEDQRQSGFKYGLKHATKQQQDKGFLDDLSWDDPVKWAGTMGRGIAAGVTQPAKGFWKTAQLAGDITGYEPLEKFGKRHAEEVEKTEKYVRGPRKEGALGYLQQAGEVMGRMGGTALMAPPFTVPALATQAGVEKAVEGREEGQTKQKALSGGLVQGMTEYLTEIVPYRILADPAKKFIKRLAHGLVADVPGEVAQTASEMKLVDDWIYGKSNNLEEYKKALLDTAVISGIATGGMTAGAQALHKEKEKADIKPAEARSDRYINKELEGEFRALELDEDFAPDRETAIEQIEQQEKEEPPKTFLKHPQYAVPQKPPLLPYPREISQQTTEKPPKNVEFKPIGEKTARREPPKPEPIDIEPVQESINQGKYRPKLKKEQIQEFIRQQGMNIDLNLSKPKLWNEAKKKWQELPAQQQEEQAVITEPKTYTRQLTDTEKALLKETQEQLYKGESSQVIQTQGEQGEPMYYRTGSSNPPAFVTLGKNYKGITKKAVRGLINKALAGKQLTPKQSNMLEDLLEAKEREREAIETPQEEEQTLVRPIDIGLNIGSAFEVGGERFTVKNRDEEGVLLIETDKGFEVSMQESDVMPRPDEGSIKHQQESETQTGEIGGYKIKQTPLGKYYVDMGVARPEAETTQELKQIVKGLQLGKKFEQVLPEQERSGEEVETGGAFQEEQVAPDITTKVREAYDRVAAKSSFGSINISDLQKESNIPYEKLKPTLQRMAREGSAVLSLGEYSMATQEEREGGIQLAGEKRPQLVVKIKPKEERHAGLPIPKILRSIIETRPGKKVKRFWDITSTLPGKTRREYLSNRYRAMGAMVRAQKNVEKMTKKLREFSKDVREQMYRVLDGREDIKTLPENAKGTTKRVRSILDKLGGELVELDVISEKTFMENRGKYIKHLYHRYFEEGKLSGGGGTKTSPLDYAMARTLTAVTKRTEGGKYQVRNQAGNILSEEFQTREQAEIARENKQKEFDKRKKELGEIEDVSIAAPVGVLQGLRDVASLKWFKWIANNPELAWKKSAVTHKGKRYTIGQLQDEIQAMERVYDEGRRPESKEELDKLKTLLGELEDLARIGRESGEIDASDWKQLPTNKRYGDLSGMYVRKEIAYDLQSVYEVSKTELSDTLHAILGINEEMMKYFKIGRVALNPPAMFRNGISGGIQVWMSGKPLWTFPRMLKDTIVAMSTRNQFYQNAIDDGVFRTDFSSTEIDGFKNTMEKYIRKGRSFKFWDILNMAKDLAQHYGKIDDFWKLTHYIANRKEGMRRNDATIEAQDWGFDYSLAHPIIKTGRRRLVPFATFYYKMFPKFVEAGVRSPWKIAIALSFPTFLEEVSREALGVDKEDWDKYKKRYMPKWTRKGTSVLMPWKSPSGDFQVVDIGYFLPWEQVISMGRAARELDVKKGIETIGIGNPMLDVYSVIKGIQGEEPPRDPFTGQPVWNYFDPWWLKAGKSAGWFVNNFLPTVVQSRGFAGKMGEAVKGEKDRYGRETTYPQAVGRLFGVNIIAPTKMQSLIGKKAKMSDIKAEYYRKIRDIQDDTEEIQRVNDKFAETYKEIILGEGEY